jgi:two-component system, LytTR family, sensor kinase
VKTDKRIYWGLQIGGWISYGLLIVMFTSAIKPEVLSNGYYIKVAINVVVAVALTHLMREVILRRQWLQINLLPVLPRVLGLSLFISLLMVLANRGVGQLINLFVNGNYSFDPSRLVVDVLANFILILFWNSIYFSYCFFKKYYFQEINNLTIESNLRETELKNLRNQLNPHFLFNSLNSIKALIEINPSKAKESLTILSSVLRSSLITSQNGLVSLTKEIELVKNYLQLESIRFEERLDVQWSIIENTDSIMVPPFMIQMMVENAVKHGISNLVEGGKIKIVIRQNNQGLIIQVKNTGQIGSNEETYGIGLENTKRRLDLQYKNKASLLMYEEEDMVVSQVLLKN